MRYWSFVMWAYMGGAVAVGMPGVHLSASGLRGLRKLAGHFMEKKVLKKNQSQWEKDSLWLCGRQLSASPGYTPLLELAGLVQRRPDWAEVLEKTMGFLQKRAEKAGWVGQINSDQQKALRAFFENHPPLTMQGWRLLASICPQGVDTKLVDKTFAQLFRQTWQTQGSTLDWQQEALQELGFLLTLDDHKKRIGLLIAERNLDLARGLLESMEVLAQSPASKSPNMAQEVSALRLVLDLITKEKPDSGRAFGVYQAASRSIKDNPLVQFAAVCHCLRTSQSLEAYAVWQKAGFSGDGLKALIARSPAFKERCEATLFGLMRELLQAGQKRLRQGDKAGAVALFSKAVDPRLIGTAKNWREQDWICGFIQYAALGQPKKALPHFLRLFQQAGQSESTWSTRQLLEDDLLAGRYRARGAFWAGLCYKALGQQDKAIEFWHKAARYPFYFYGQMAHLMLEKPLELSFASGFSGANHTLEKSDHQTDAKDDARAQSPEPMAGDLGKTGAAVSGQRLFLLWSKLWRKEQQKAGVPWHVFMPAQGLLMDDLAARAQTPKDRRLCLDLIKEVSPQRATFFAKGFSRSPDSVFKEAYPRADLPIKPRDRALVYSIALAETCFNPHVISSAGARGIMQIMPLEVPRIAARAGVPASIKALSQERYGWILGITEIAMKLEAFGSYPLAIASYNADPKHTLRWMKEGPIAGRSLQETLFWIESIPFAETRSYVPRVLEHWAIYRCLLGQPPTPKMWAGVVSMKGSLTGKSPKIVDSEKMIGEAFFRLDSGDSDSPRLGDAKAKRAARALQKADGQKDKPAQRKTARHRKEKDRKANDKKEKGRKQGKARPGRSQSKGLKADSLKIPPSMELCARARYQDPS
jgi:tetratricopeptide (TPR) repeat protein